MKRTVTDKVYCGLSPDTLSTTIAKAIEKLQHLAQKHGPDAELSWDKDFYYEYDTSPSPTFHIYKYRLETDKEYEKRLAEEKQRKEETESRERALLAELLKKYPK